MEQADRRLDYFYTTLRRLDDFTATSDSDDGEVIAEAEALLPESRRAMADDFNAPAVLAAMSDAARAANKLLDEPKGINKALRKRSLQRLARDLRQVAQGALGILMRPPGEFLAERRDRLARQRGVDGAEVAELLAARTAARAAKDFATADALRDSLAAKGVEVLDTPRGVDWRIKE